MTVRELTVKYNHLCKCIDDFKNNLLSTDNTLNQIIVSSQPIQHLVISNINYNIPISGNVIYITYTGVGNGIFTLPPIEDSEWERWIIINHGSGILTLQTNGGDNDIYSVGGNVSFVTIDPGVSFIIYNNSVDFSNIQ